jgi:hypothetical protein
MKMKKLIIGILAVCSFMAASAQNNAGKSDDAARIVLNTIIPQGIEGMTEGTAKFLKNKLDQIATANGVGGSSHIPKFIITANIVIVSKDITPTAPPMTAVTLDVTFFVGNYETQTKFASTTMQVKGVGTNETKAYTEALKQIKSSAPELKSMVETGKTKIMEYYNSQCDFIIKKAETLASQSKFEEAMFELSQVPDVCKECYNKCMTAVGPIYVKYKDKNCLERLNAAKAAWAASQNTDGAAKVAEILAPIDPDAKCVPDVKAFVAEVKERVLALDKREWDFKMKVFDSSVDLAKQSIEAARQVGIAYGENQPETQIVMKPW